MSGEARVQVRQQRIAQRERDAHLPGHLITKEPRLAPLGLEFGVRPQKRVEDGRLVPAYQ